MLLPKYSHFSDLSHFKLSPELLQQALNSLLLPLPKFHPPNENFKHVNKIMSVTLLHSTFLMLSSQSEQKQQFSWLLKPKWSAWPFVPAPTHPNHSFPHSIPATLAFSLFLQIANTIPPTSWLYTCCALGYKYISQLVTWLASLLQVSVNITSSETPFPNYPIYNSPRPTHSPFSPILCTTTQFLFLIYHHLTYCVFTFFELSTVHLPTLE